MQERFEILRSPIDPDRFALRFMFANGEKRTLGSDFRRRGDVTNVAEAIESACVEAATGEAQIGNIEVRDLTLLEDDDRPSPYHRANRGTVVHLEACGFSKLSAISVPWAYARHMTSEEVIAEVDSLPWLRLCKRCWSPELTRLGRTLAHGYEPTTTDTQPSAPPSPAPRFTVKKDIAAPLWGIWDNTAGTWVDQQAADPIEQAALYCGVPLWRSQREAADGCDRLNAADV